MHESKKQYASSPKTIKYLALCSGKYALYWKIFTFKNQLPNNNKRLGSEMRFVQLYKRRYLPLPLINRHHGTVLKLVPRAFIRQWTWLPKVRCIVLSYVCATKFLVCIFLDIQRIVLVFFLISHLHSNYFSVWSALEK